MLDQPLIQNIKRSEQHGLMVLNLLAHQPVTIKGETYTGLAPAANFIFLETNQPDRLKVGIDWILKQSWNTRILLNLAIPDGEGWMFPMEEDPDVKALQPAIDTGLLIVAAGGNSKVHNRLHANQFFTIGGFNDKGSRKSERYEPHPSVPFGYNSDGYWRPDLLAPYTYLPLPNLVGKKSAELDFFAGTYGASTLIAGLLWISQGISELGNALSYFTITIWLDKARRFNRNSSVFSTNSLFKHLT